MKEANKEIIVNHKAAELYSIVLDVEKYPDYIPWCTKIEILVKGKKQMKANMIVDYKLFPSQKFTSKVIFDSKSLIIKTKYIEGPLKNLNTIWNFIDLKKNQSKVVFNLEFEFSNYFHQKLAELFLPLIESKMMESFIQRADETLD